MSSDPPSEQERGPVDPWRGDRSTLPPVESRAQPRRDPGPEPRAGAIPAPARPAERPIRYADPPVRRARGAVRRLKRTVRHVDPGSVLKISLFLYAIFLVFWLLLVAVVYWVVQSSGWLGTIEQASTAFAFDKVEIAFWTVERWAFLVGLTFVVIGSIINVVVSVLYNIAADLLGGVEMTFVERDL